MKLYNPGGHSAYQKHVMAQLRKHYPDDASSLSASTWKTMEKFWNLDLSGLDSIMAGRYSDFGPQTQDSESLCLKYSMREEKILLKNFKKIMCCLVKIGCVL